MRTKSTRIWNQFPTAHSIVVILRALLHIDPPFRPDLAGALCVLGRQLVAADDPDVRLCVGSVGANPCLGIPTAIGFDGVDLDPIAAGTMITLGPAPICLGDSSIRRSRLPDVADARLSLREPRPRASGGA
jgi:hypothetical protein